MKLETTSHFQLNSLAKASFDGAGFAGMLCFATALLTFGASHACKASSLGTVKWLDSTVKWMSTSGEPTGGALLVAGALTNLYRYDWGRRHHLTNESAKKFLLEKAKEGDDRFVKNLVRTKECVPPIRVWHLRPKKIDKCTDRPLLIIEGKWDETNKTLTDPQVRFRTFFRSDKEQVLADPNELFALRPDWKKLEPKA